MPIIRYTTDHAEIEVNDAATILQTSLNHHIPHIHVCGGNARCSTCRVLVLESSADCPPRNEKEQAMAERLGFPPEIRLACQTPITCDLTIRRLVLDNEDIAVVAQPTNSTRAEAVGVEKKAAIMFADIRDFTRFSESHLPYDVIHLLNRYYHRVGNIIRHNGGHIANYMGDGMMALFEEEGETAANRAVQSGLEMLQAVQDLRPYVQEVHNWDLRIGVGVHYGWVVVGNIGTRNHIHETAIGDAVNFASRIESQTKAVGAALLISADTLAALSLPIQVGQTCTVSVKGKSGEHTLYEILG